MNQNFKKNELFTKQKGMKAPDISIIPTKKYRLYFNVRNPNIKEKRLRSIFVSFLVDRRIIHSRFIIFARMTL